MVNVFLWELMFPGCCFWNAAAVLLTLRGLEFLYFRVPHPAAFTWDVITRSWRALKLGAKVLLWVKIVPNNALGNHILAAQSFSDNKQQFQKLKISIQHLPFNEFRRLLCTNVVMHPANTTGWEFKP